MITVAFVKTFHLSKVFQRKIKTRQINVHAWKHDRFCCWLFINMVIVQKY